MDRNFKIVEVFQHSEKDKDLSRILVWDDEEQSSQLILQSLDDPENLYYGEDFISLVYGLDHKVIIHND